MKNNKFYDGLLKKGVAMFPIDSKKVPFSLQEEIKSYPSYIEYMTRHYIAIAKTGTEQVFRLKSGAVSSLLPNAMAIIHELTARLLERSKLKKNRLVKVCLKTPTSINFDIY